jgi:hypothetical protein
MTAHHAKYEKFVSELTSRCIDLVCQLSAKTGDNLKVNDLFNTRNYIKFSTH